MRHHESTKLLYLPEELRGSGMKSVEDTYKLTTIKMANYLNNSDDKRIKYARTLEMNRITQGRVSIFKHASKYAAEYKVVCNFDDTATTISTIIIWLCPTRTGNYQIHAFDWLKCILTAV